MPGRASQGRYLPGSATTRDEAQGTETSKHQGIRFGLRDGADDAEVGRFEGVDIRRIREDQARDASADELHVLRERLVAIGRRKAQARCTCMRASDVEGLRSVRAIDRQQVVGVRRAPQEADVVDGGGERQRGRVAHRRTGGQEAATEKTTVHGKCICIRERCVAGQRGAANDGGHGTAQRARGSSGAGVRRSGWRSTTTQGQEEWRLYGNPATRWCIYTATAFSGFPFRTLHGMVLQTAFSGGFRRRQASRLLTGYLVVPNFKLYVVRPFFGEVFGVN